MSNEKNTVVTEANATVEKSITVTISVIMNRNFGLKEVA